MNKTIIKRDGSVVLFDSMKISRAVEKAFFEIDNEISENAIYCAQQIANEIEQDWKPNITVENVQDMVETKLMGSNRKDVAQAYIRYRYEHALAREKYSELIDAVQEKLEASNVQNQNANLDENSFGGRMGEMGSAVATTYALDYMMSPRAKYNHKNNRIYTHDLNSYAVGMHNCLTLPLDNIFDKGFNTRQTDIRAPKSVSTAFQLLAVTFQTQSLCQFGGVAAGHIDWTMVPYVRMSFYKHFKDGIKYIDTFASIPEFDINRSIEDNVYKRHSKAYQYAMDMTKKEVHQSVEGAYHNLNSLQSRSGNQLPFSSINYGTCTLPEGRMVTKAILECSLEGTGKLHKTPIFPCGIFTMKKGVNYPGDPNYDLFKLALKSTSKRLYPNYGNGDWTAQKSWIKYDRDKKQEVLNELSDTEYKKLYDIVSKNAEIADFLMLTPSLGKLYVNQDEKPGELFATMGCRTVNGADVNAKKSYERNIKTLINGGQIMDDIYSAAQKDGRGNICPVTIILPTLAMEAKESCNSDDPIEVFDKFIEILNKAIEEAKDQLIDRFNHICAQKPEAAQFMYENRTMAGFIQEEGIKSALIHGTLAIGQLGLAEALQLIFGFDHTSQLGMKYAKKIEQLYKDKCGKYKEKYNLNFGVYYSPAENLSYTAMKKFQKRYGVIEGVSDKEYFTNSMHVPVYKKMDPFQKIDIESQLTGYSSAGCITYVELESTVKNNLEALETLVLYAMDKDIPYFAINVPNDTCMNCGFCDEINESCPQCGGTDIQRLRRVTGYLTGDYKSAFNKGKQQEVEMRVKHR